MSHRKFTVSFLITMTIVCFLMYYFSTIEEMKDYVDLGWYSTILFTGLSILVYTYTRRIEHTTRKALFIQLVVLNMLAKMVLSVGLVAVYHNIKSPENGVFVIPFIAVYVIFTIFETYFMNQQARAK